MHTVPIGLEVLLQTPAAEAVARRILAAGEELHAPHLIDVEIADILRRYALAGELDAARGLSALDDLATLPLERYPHRFLLARAWEVRDDVTAYDAVYVALAEALHAPLITRAQRLAASAGHRVRIELI